MQLTLEERIRQRAYFLSESAGGGGDDTHFWLIAEREVLAEDAIESSAAAQIVEAIQTEVLPAAEPTQVAPSQPNKPARKTRPAGKTSAKSSAKSAPAAAVQSAVVTPIKSATKAPAKSAITPANKARARAAAR